MRFGEQLVISTIGFTFRVFVCHLDSDVLIVLILCNRRKQWHPTPVLLPGKSHGEPGRLQSMGSRRVRHDWATSLSLFTLMHWRRKWQPTPVFCLENPRDGGAWLAAVYGVAQSRTRLKQLRSSSSSSSILCNIQNYSKLFSFSDQ